MKLHRFPSADHTTAFCHKNTEAPNKGWALRGSPGHAFDAAHGVKRCGRAVVTEAPGTCTAETKLEAF